MSDDIDFRILCAAKGTQIDITQAGNLMSMIFGGEGLFFADLKGTGTVYLQSLPFSRLSAPAFSISDLDVLPFKFIKTNYFKGFPPPRDGSNLNASQYRLRFVTAEGE